MFNADAANQVAAHNASRSTMSQIYMDSAASAVSESNATTPYQQTDPGEAPLITYLGGARDPAFQFSSRTLDIGGDKRGINSSTGVRVTSTQINKSFGMACIQDAESSALVIEGTYTAPALQISFL